MLIYSVIPPELLVAGLENNSKGFEEIIDGVKVQIEPIGENTARINRILSTNPQDFLNPKLQPGQLVSYIPH